MKRWCDLRPVALVLSFLISTLGGGALAFAADLTAEQQKLLEAAQAQLKQADANLELALQSAGPGTAQPTGSKAKLAMMRLNSAKGPMANVTALLEKLPADNADVQAFQTQVDDVAARMAALESRLAGGTTEQAAPTDGGVKLDYKQEAELKNARFFVREIEGLDAALKQLVEQVKPVQDPSTLDHRLIAQGMNTVARARERAKTAHGHLDPLPADGQGVRPVAEQLQQLMASIDAADAVLAPIHQKLSAQLDPAGHSNLAAHTERLRELATMFGNPNVLVDDPVRAAELVAQAPAALEERQRLEKQYSILINQQTEDGKRVAGVSRYFDEKCAAFSAAAAERKSALPAEIQADLDAANALADQAVQEKKPLFFTGGIPQRVEWAESKLALYAALDPPGAGTVRQKVSTAREHLRAQQALLRESIIASNELPPDRYAGGDRDVLGRLAVEAWKQVQPDAEILAIRIPSQDWKREQIWRNQTGDWYKIDRSGVQVQLIVRHDGKLAVVRPINMWKDHLSNDQIIGLPLNTPTDELQPHEFLLLEKVK